MFLNKTIVYFQQSLSVIAHTVPIIQSETLGVSYAVILHINNLIQTDMDYQSETPGTSHGVVSCGNNIYIREIDYSGIDT